MRIVTMALIHAIRQFESLSDSLRFLDSISLHYAPSVSRNSGVAQAKRAARKRRNGKKGGVK